MHATCPVYLVLLVYYKHYGAPRLQLLHSAAALCPYLHVLRCTLVSDTRKLHVFFYFNRSIPSRFLFTETVSYFFPTNSNRLSVIRSGTVYEMPSSDLGMPYVITTVRAYAAVFKRRPKRELTAYTI